MIEYLQAVLLGIIQGLTEPLPVSSSGHLLLGQYFMGLNQEEFGLTFDLALHVGTLVAVVSVFWRDLVRMTYAFVAGARSRDFSAPDGRLSLLVIAATLPAAVIGFFFEDFFSTAVRSPWIVAFNLVLVGIIFIVVERLSSRSRMAYKLGVVGALAVGFAQAAALVPGVSRSGATIVMGMFLGLERREAARFSFLMSVPIIAGAAALKLGQAFSEGLTGAQLQLFAIGLISSAVVGYMAIRFLLSYLTNHSLRAFAYYRFGLAGVVVGVLLLL